MFGMAARVPVCRLREGHALGVSNLEKFEKAGLVKKAGVHGGYGNLQCASDGAVRDETLRETHADKERAVLLFFKQDGVIVFGYLVGQEGGKFPENVVVINIANYGELRDRDFYVVCDPCVGGVSK